MYVVSDLVPIRFVVLEKTEKQCPFEINNQWHQPEIVQHLLQGMEVVQIILMVAVVAVDREVRDFSIQTLTFIHLIQIRILMGVTAVHIARTRQIIKVHIFQMVSEIIITVIIVVMPVLQYLLKRWLILT